jgi:GDP-L-fucose synthase
MAFDAKAGFAGKRILVAGGTGFLGGALLRRLAAAGAVLRATHLTRAPDFLDPAVEWLRADLREQADCARAVAGMEMVLICAAVTSGACMITASPLMHVTPNVILNASILDAAHAAGVAKVLFLSSGAVYPELGDVALKETDVMRGDPPPVYYPAGWMKRYAEILCRTYALFAKPAMAAAVLRVSNVYGPRDKFDLDTAHVTSAQIRKVADRHRPIVVWGTGEEERDLLYIDDFAEGALRALAQPGPYFEANLAAGSTVSIRRIVETAIAADGFAGAEIRYDPAGPRTIARRRFDVSALRALGFTPSVGLDEGIARTIAWYRKTYPGQK